LLEECDEGEKELALQTVLVEPVRRLVRRRHDHHSGVEECREQASEDHRIGDVVDLEFVEAQKRRFRGDVGGDLVDGLLRLGAALPFDAVMHFEHKGMEMDPPLARVRHRGEEQIHQHRFAASDRAAQIEPDRDLVAAVLAEAEARQPSAQPGFGPIMQQRAVKALQLFNRQLLRLVGLQQPLSAQLSIARQRLSHRACRVGAGSCHRHGDMRLSVKAQGHG
jgi:hypothetical protein